MVVIGMTRSTRFGWNGHPVIMVGRERGFFVQQKDVVSV